MTEAKRLLPSDRREVLEASSRALDQEAHNFGQWPHLMWQQLYNRLQWDDEPVPQVLAAGQFVPIVLHDIPSPERLRAANARGPGDDGGAMLNSSLEQEK